MSKINTIKKNYQFRAVYNKGKSVANKYIVVFVLKNRENENKIGISVSKRVGNSVTRNRIRRLIKESYRNMEDDIKTGYDIVIIARQPACNVEYKQIYSGMKHLFHKQKILK